VTDKLFIDPKTTALLVMDFQMAIVDNFATDKEALLSATASLLDAAREAQAMVVYVVVGFRPGYPEINRRNVSFSAVKEAGLFAAGSSGAEIHPAIAPRPGEAIVTKHRVGAFAGTDLDMILRANGVETLALAGIATSGVVLSTVRHASDADYRLIVVKDCCSDRDGDVHRVLVEKVFLRQAAVVTAAEVVHAFGARI
jgi:nicotinamidase-related amidase